MARKGSMDYNLIFGLYEINRYGKHNLHNIRQSLRRYLRNYLNKIQCEDKTWDDLSEDDQAEFVCNYIRPLMTSYAAKEDQHRIACNIENYKQLHQMVGVEEVKKLNAAMSHLYDCFDIQGTSSQKRKQNAYACLCSILSDYNCLMPVPSYDEFIANPLRPYDYVKEYENSVFLSNYEAQTPHEHKSNEYNPELEKAAIDYAIAHKDDPMEDGDNVLPAQPQPQVIDNSPLETHYVIKILLKVLKDLIGLEIDFDSLRDCIQTTNLSNYKNPELFVIPIFQLDYDPSCGMTPIEFENHKKKKLKYEACRKKLNTLDSLYTVKKIDPHK